MKSAKRVRLSVDTGGTFTDVVVLDEDTGAFSIAKAPTTPANVLEGLLTAIQKTGVDLAAVERFLVCGSTTALNALLERKGVRTAYVATRGFRDVPQIGRINRPEMYNPKYQKPQQLVPRDLRFEVLERLGADGSILTPLDEADVIRVADQIRRCDVKAVAVCLLHAYRNGAHERRVKALLEKALPGVLVTISSEVAPEPREFERATTTILNAYLAPVVATALNNLEGTLKERGFRGDVVLTKSDGGGMSTHLAKRSPINTLLSGPAGGVMGSVYLAEVIGLSELVTADVGGTSLDVSVIKKGIAPAKQELSAAGFPALISSLDIRTIGAGGGSIARIDSAGALHVGPQSAGAQPGPICYGRGGREPTVTDAALVSGYINPQYFLGGEMGVDLKGAERGIGEKVASVLNIPVREAATGILRIALSHMAGAIRDVLSEAGDDPRDFTLLAYGGGGPLFAGALVDELQLRGAVIPVVPANFSAWGMLMIDIRHDVVESIGKGLKDLDPGQLSGSCCRMELMAEGVLDKEEIESDRRDYSFSLDMRYRGQGHTVCVPLARDSNDSLIDSIQEQFTQIYREVYGYSLDLPAEVANLRLKAVGRIPKPRLKRLEHPSIGQPAREKGRRGIVDMLDGRALDCLVYDRGALRDGACIRGPALIEEATAVTPIRVGQQCAVDAYGNLLVSRSTHGRNA